MKKIAVNRIFCAHTFFFESPNIPMHLKGSSIWKVQFKNEHVYRTPKSPCARWQQISESFFITLALVSFAYSTKFVRICDCKKQKKVASFRHDPILKTRWSGRNLKCARGNWTGMHCTRALFFEPNAHWTQKIVRVRKSCCFSMDFFWGVQTMRVQFPLANGQFSQ